MPKSTQKLSQRLHLNLLYPQGIPQKLPVKFLKWLIAYGRFIVVLVEILVLTGFLLRFKFDAELADLKEQINAQVPFIESLSQDEALIKQTQLKLTTTKQVYTQTTLYSNIVQKITSQTPQSVKVINIGVKKESTVLKFNITARSNSNSDIAGFLEGLRSEPIFKNVNLNNVSFEQGQVIFTINGEVIK